jgi:hypothetical protein
VPQWVPDPNPDPAVELERVVLERLKIAAAASVTREVLAGAGVRVVADHLTQQLMVKLESYVLAEHLADTTDTRTVQVPATALDHLKRDHPHAFAWWQRWVWLARPPRMAAITLTTTWTDRAAYPHARLALPPHPKLGPVVLWRTALSHLEDTRWDDPNPA